MHYQLVDCNYAPFGLPIAMQMLVSQMYASLVQFRVGYISCLQKFDQDYYYKTILLLGTAKAHTPGNYHRN